ncbi:MAG: bifunctional DNA primase/polymerase [Thermogutta sp.]
MNDAVEFLRRYAEYGYRLHPLRPNDKKPLLRDWPAKASNDWDAIREWLRRRAACNLGLATGMDAAGRTFSVLDIDPDALDASPPWPWDSEKSQSLKATGCPLAMTPRGGFHLVFRADWPCSAGRIAKGVDTRGRGGFIAVAPSIVNGRGYRWIRPLVPADQLPPPPDWLAELVARATRKPESASNSAGWRESVPTPEEIAEAAAEYGGTFQEGSRNSGLTSLAGRMRRMGFGDHEILAALIAANRIRCSPPLPDNEVAAIARSICRYPPGRRSGPSDRRSPSSRLMAAAWRRGIAYARKRRQRGMA